MDNLKRKTVCCKIVFLAINIESQDNNSDDMYLLSLRHHSGALFTLVASCCLPRLKAPPPRQSRAEEAPQSLGWG